MTDNARILSASSGFNLPPGCTVRDIDGPETYQCVRCGAKVIAEKASELAFELDCCEACKVDLAYDRICEQSARLRKLERFFGDVQEAVERLEPSR